jgi:cytochrome c
MMIRDLMISAVVVAASTGDAVAQDLAAGETAFRKCQICHDVGEAAKNKLGPELNGLDGRKAGTVEGYAYSDADKNSGIVWSEASFKDYLENPQEKMPGTKMILSVKNEKELADLWAYLKQFETDGNKKSQ